MMPITFSPAVGVWHCLGSELVNHKDKLANKSFMLFIIPLMVSIILVLLSIFGHVFLVMVNLTLLLIMPI